MEGRVRTRQGHRVAMRGYDMARVCGEGRGTVREEVQ